MSKIREVVRNAIVEAITPDINIKHSEYEFLVALKKLGGARRWVSEFDLSQAIGVSTSRAILGKAKRLEELGLLEIDHSRSRNGVGFKLTQLSLTSELSVWMGRSETGDDLGRHHLRLRL